MNILNCSKSVKLWFLSQLAWITQKQLYWTLKVFCSVEIKNENEKNFHKRKTHSTSLFHVRESNWVEWCLWLHSNSTKIHSLCSNTHTNTWTRLGFSLYKVLGSFVCVLSLIDYQSKSMLIFLRTIYKTVPSGRGADPGEIVNTCSERHWPSAQLRSKLVRIKLLFFVLNFLVFKNYISLSNQIQVCNVRPLKRGTFWMQIPIKTICPKNDKCLTTLVFFRLKL